MPLTNNEKVDNELADNIVHITLRVGGIIIVLQICGIVVINILPFMGVLALTWLTLPSTITLIKQKYNEFIDIKSEDINENI